MAEREQNYKNHARLRPGFHFFVMPVLLANFIIAGLQAFRVPSLTTLFGALFAMALLVLALEGRLMALRVQDRLIRLEMRMRLQQVLPPDLEGRIHELKPGQLVALRFASDGELPDLVRQVLAGSLPTPKDIKQRIQNWQPDWFRA